jgi:hypothetical protein
VLVFTDKENFRNAMQKAGEHDKANDCIILQRLCAVVYLCTERSANNGTAVVIGQFVPCETWYEIG